MSDVPPGSLLEASNIVIRRDGMAQSRPGFEHKLLDDSITPPTGTPRRIIPWGTALLYVTSAGATMVDAAANDVLTPAGIPISGLNFGTPGTDFTAKSVQTRGCLYVTANTGLKKLSSTTATAVEAVGIDGSTSPWLAATLDGSGLGFLAAGKQCAYRLMFTRQVGTGVQASTIQSSVGSRMVATGSGVLDRVSLAIILDTAQVQAGDTIQVYRTTSQGAVASDEMFLVSSDTLTATHISNKSISLLDAVLDAQLGAALYVNASQEGIAQNNDTPVRYVDVCMYKDSVWGATSVGKKSTLISWTTTVSALTGVATGIGYRLATATTTIGFPTLTIINTTVGWTVGAIITGVGIPQGTTLTVVGAATATMSANATASAAVDVIVHDVIQFDGDSFMASDPRGFVTGVNAGTIVPTYFSASGAKSTNYQARIVADVYDGSFSTSVTTTVMIESRVPGYATAWGMNATKPTEYVPALGVLGATYSSNASYVTLNQIYNGLFYSKTSQPEAWPGTAAGNLIRVGSSSFIIDRILATRDALWIFKRDGIFRLTGSGIAGGWRVDPVDYSRWLLSADSAVVADDTIIAWTNDGVVQISDSGIEKISALSIDNLLTVPQLAAAPVPYQPATSSVMSGWAIWNSTTNEYCLFVPTFGVSLTGTLYVFNTKTIAWMTWTLPRYAYHGAIDGSSMVAFAVSTDAGAPVIDLERNYINNTTPGGLSIDYEAPGTFTIGSNATQIILDAPIADYTPTVGDVFVGSPSGQISYITEVTDLTRFTISPGAADEVACSLASGIPCAVKFVAKMGGNSGTEKFWRDGCIVWGSTMYMNQITTTFTSSVNLTAVSTALSADNWPSNGTDIPMSMRFWVPRNHARSSSLFVKLSWSSAGATPILYGLTLVDTSQSEVVRR